MSTLAVIFNAEFVRRIRSRPYLIGTAIGALGVALIAVIPSFMVHAVSSSTRNLVLVGPPALTTPAGAALRPDFSVVAVLPRLDATPTLAFLDAHRHASAVATLSRTGSRLHALVYARDPSLFPSSFARDLGPLQIALATGAPLESVRSRLTVPIDVRDVAGRFENAGEADAAKAVAYLFVLLLYLAILLNAQAISTSVTEEKTNRIAELLVAAVDPVQLLTAKILAATATGFVQLGVWTAIGFLAGSKLTEGFTNGDVGANAGPLAISSSEILLFVAFFLVGFAQYSVLFAGGASLVSRTEDVGSITGPLMLPVVGAFVLAQLGIQFPNGPLMSSASFVPLLAPFVMFTRIAVTPVPAWQIALSLAINVAAAILFALIAGRVYRVGMLLYGRPPSLRQIVAAMRA
ncbi:MAG TPA: ABC transporter permease [Candidatus Sulfotelmatobacter sp.]|nr:ABC transporter permease [Candidatus Sulfotelmatobacter sp.]